MPRSFEVPVNAADMPITRSSARTLAGKKQSRSKKTTWRILVSLMGGRLMDWRVGTLITNSCSSLSWLNSSLPRVTRAFRCTDQVGSRVITLEGLSGFFGLNVVYVRQLPRYYGRTNFGVKRPKRLGCTSWSEALIEVFLQVREPSFFPAYL